MLYVLATPIGNLDDISFRALDTLRNVDLILAEDTRRIKKLLSKYEINTKVISYNDYTSEKKENFIIEFIKNNKSVVLVSDSGTPLISDPGYSIVNKVIENNISISPIPGPCAAISALSVSGCTVDKFSFYGFFPKKNSSKNKVIKKIIDSDMTLIFYESPYRILKTLELLKNNIQNRKICVARELTKKFEEIISCDIENVVDKINNSTIKGEYTIVIDKKK
jgi:16S rRNA (cytidine1402-2'-O)-methyltransferase